MTLALVPRLSATRRGSQLLRVSSAVSGRWTSRLPGDRRVEPTLLVQG